MVIDLLPVDPRKPWHDPTLHRTRTATRRVNVFDALSCMSPWPFLTLQHLLVFYRLALASWNSCTPVTTACQYLINTYLTSAMAAFLIISKAKVVIQA